MRGGIGLDRYGSGSDIADCQQGRDISVAGDDDLVARTDVAGAQRKLKRVQSVAHPDTVTGAAVRGERGLELNHFLTANVPPRRADPRDRRIDVIGDLAISGSKVEKRNRHADGAFTKRRKAAWSRI